MAIEPSKLNYWFHESVSCLHDCMAMILQSRGQEPIAVLGAHWCFFHDPAHVSAEEFYYPTRSGELGRDLAPYHQLGARWRLAPDSDALLSDIRASLDEGRPAMLVEDNFFMPNRPAFQDVHAAHLVLVTAYDRAADSLQIMEPTPPLYHGPIAWAQLEQAVGSDNQARAQSRDFFFAGSSIGLRWIEVDAFAPLPAMDGDGLRAILERNLDELGATGMSGQLVGIDGLETYLRDLVASARRSSAVLRAVIVHGVKMPVDRGAGKQPVQPFELAHQAVLAQRIVIRGGQQALDLLPHGKDDGHADRPVDRQHLLARLRQDADQLPDRRRLQPRIVDPGRLAAGPHRLGGLQDDVLEWLVPQIGMDNLAFGRSKH